MEHDDRVPLPHAAAPSTGGLSKTDESVTDQKPMLEFTCSICAITAPYEHYSHESPKGCSRKIKFREKCYNLPDPFRPPRERLVMVVGAACSECAREMVCLNCSLYYSRRFCVKCVRKYRDEFPRELKKEIARLDERYAEIKAKKKNADIAKNMPYAAEVKCIMFVNGDTDEPGEPAARLVENTVRLELVRLLSKCSGNNDDEVIRLADIIFQLRGQVKLLIRIYRQMKVWDQKDRRERVNEQLNPALDLVDFRSRLRNTLNTECDPLKTASLNMQSDRISLLSDNEYEHYAYCKRASFGGFLSQRASHYGVCMKNSQQDQHRRRMSLKSTKMEQLGAKPRVERLQRFRDWV